MRRFFPFDFLFKPSDIERNKFFSQCDAYPVAGTAAYCMTTTANKLKELTTRKDEEE